MTANSSEKFCLRWNDFESNISSSFRELRDDKELLDVSLACDDSTVVQAHKVILSACSTFFRSVLQKHPHQHPLLYLRGVKYVDLVAVLDFMYHGEVNVKQEELNSFLAVAEDLNVKGLTQNQRSEEPSADDGTKAVKRDPVKRPFISENSHPSPGQRPFKQMKANVSPSQNNHLVNRLPHPPATEEEVQEVVLPPRLAVKTETQDTIVEVEEENHVMQEYEDPEIENSYDNYQHGYENDSIHYDNSITNARGTIGESSQGDFCDFDAFVSENSAKLPGSRSLQCLICQKVTLHIGNMKQHFEVHHYHRSYKCCVCEKIFKTKNSLDVHKKTQNHQF